MADWNKPDASSNYSTEYFTELNAKFDALATMNFSSITTNLASNTIKWDSTNARFEKWNGSAWGELVAEYKINVEKVGGQLASYYRNADNLNAGTLPAARFNDTAHGNRSGGALHAVATVSVAGFMSAADKSKLDGVATGAEVNPDVVSQAEAEAGTATTERTWTAQRVKQAIDANQSPGIPSGAVAYFAMNSAPTGWLKANGAAISRTTYADLFAVIGTTFGVGDGTTTFNLPDLRGEFMRGWDDARGVDSGRTFGSSQSDAFKSHNHSSKVTLAAANAAAMWAVDAGGGTQISNITSTGGSETRPRNIALLACIKY